MTQRKAARKKSKVKKAPARKQRTPPAGLLPEIKIDEKVVEGMATVGATNVEIAEYLGVSEALIRKKCGPVLEKARAEIRVKLRRAQLKVALGGNPTMLIWLGKQMLGQKEKLEHTGEGGGAIAVDVRFVGSGDKPDSR